MRTTVGAANRCAQPGDKYVEPGEPPALLLRHGWSALDTFGNKIVGAQNASGSSAVE